MLPRKGDPFRSHGKSVNSVSSRGRKSDAPREKNPEEGRNRLDFQVGEGSQPLSLRSFYLGRERKLQGGKKST